MQKPLLAMLVMVLSLTACGRLAESRLNPFNWFGRSQPATVQAADARVTRDRRQLVAEVTDLTLDRTQGGVIIRAVGLPPTQGYWKAELVARPIDENGVLVYDFRIFPPPRTTPVSTRQSREVVVATFLTNQKIDGIRQITVQGERSARTTRR
ncbi:MAG: hypothetical protein ACK4GO_16855 [Gemmobacter sp.]